MNAREAIAEFIAIEFLPATPAKAIPDELDLIKAGVIDSLGLLKLVAFLEEELQVVIEPDAMIPTNLNSLRAIVKLISSQLPATV